MNNKGFTTVELIVSFSLTAVIVLFLFQLSGIKLKLLTKQATINTMINDDFKNKKVTLATKESDTKIVFYFDDGTNKELSYNKDDKSITYGDYRTNLIDGSKFGNIGITTDVSTKTNDNTTLNGILTI